MCTRADTLPDDGSRIRSRPQILEGADRCADLSPFPELERPRPAMPSLPLRESGAGAFVGRKGELSELLEGLEDALSGRGRVFLLVGEPGVDDARQSAARTSSVPAESLRKASPAL